MKSVFLLNSHVFFIIRSVCFETIESSKKLKFDELNWFKEINLFPPTILLIFLIEKLKLNKFLYHCKFKSEKLKI